MSALTPPGHDPDSTRPSPTGRQWSIAHGPFEATVVEVGGGLRTMTCDGVDVVAGYGVDEPCQSGRGQQLMPWPNRLRDGRYGWAGQPQQLAITEVPFANASHGLVGWALWELLERDESSVTVGHRLHPQPGWPHHLNLRTTYRLDGTGLSVTASALNVGAAAAPFGYGAHPYLAIGDTGLPEVSLRVPARQWVPVDDRKLPDGIAPVAGTDCDFRQARKVGSVSLDTAFTDIEHDADGRWRVTVSSRGRGATLWAEPTFAWLQVFTVVARDRKGVPGIAVEPMTCPADAFNSGTSLLCLEPGQQWSGTWGVSPADAASENELATSR